MPIYKNESYGFEERAVDLVSKMTLEEKISQLGNHGAAIPRLDVPYYNYWSEASHGFFGPFKFRPMDVTSYPVCLAMSQSWDREKIKKVTSAISDECRAYNNIDGDELHMWCPTINLARDPRNGRSDENFGEDPYLAGKMAASYIQGMQGDDEKYTKVVSTPKHYALNSSENNRHRGSSNVDEATLREYYTKVFEYAIREGGAQSIMTSYNRINGVPASCNDMLLTTLLREEWGFDGFVVSDCGAVGDVYESPMFAAMGTGEKLSGHYYAKNMKEASAMTLIAGTDMSCGTEHKYNLMQAIEEGLIDESVLDRALVRIFTVRFRLGLFDDKSHVPYSSIGKESICSDEMKALSVDMANDTIVLLKNDKQILPLNKNAAKKILVVGPNAIYRELGGYSAGSMSKVVDTPVNVMALEGIRRELEGSDVELVYEKGWCCGKEFKAGGVADLLPGAGPMGGDEDAAAATMANMDPEQVAAMQRQMADFMGPNATLQEVGVAFGSPEKYVPEDPDYRKDNDELFARALEAAKDADYVIVIAGTDATNASEEHDRDTLELPYGQSEKIEKLLEVNDNTIVVLQTLGAVGGTFFEKAHTILNEHFAGQEQGTAIANVIFGKVNPNAKLTATWYKDVDELPMLNDYGLRKHDTVNFKTRTYMYYKGEPIFPFGHGLSYTTFDYSNMKVSATELDANDILKVSVDVTNSGARDGAEIVELYIGKNIPKGTDDNKPARQLKAFEKVFIKAGETKTVELTVPVSDINFWSYLRKKLIVESGTYRVEIGRSSADIACCQEVTISGEWDAPLANVYAVSDRQVLELCGTAKIKTVATLLDSTRLDLTEHRPVYTSSDNEIIRVDEHGRVTAAGRGVALVTVSVGYEGETKSARIGFAVK